MLKSVCEMVVEYKSYLIFFIVEKIVFIIYYIELNVAIVVMYTLSTARILECSWLYSRHQWFDDTCSSVPEDRK